MHRRTSPSLSLNAGLKMEAAAHAAARTALHRRTSPSPSMIAAVQMEATAQTAMHDLRAILAQRNCARIDKFRRRRGHGNRHAKGGEDITLALHQDLS